MKKVVYGIILIAAFGLTACGNDKKETSSSSKVEQLESRVKELESSSSSEAVTQNKAAEIVNKFKTKGLPVFNEFETSKSELKELNNGIVSQLSFYFKNQDTTNEKDITNLVNLSICDDSKSKDEIVANTEVLNKNSGGGPMSVKYVVNDSINGILKVGSAISDEDFNKYKEVFENIQ